MTDLSSLKQKVDSLKAEIKANSISPSRLGLILDAIVAVLDSDLSGIQTKIDNSLPPEGVFSAQLRDPEVYGNVIFIPVVVRLPTGKDSIARISIPAATTETAGLYDLDTRHSVDNAITETSDRIDRLDESDGVFWMRLPTKDNPSGVRIDLYGDAIDLRFLAHKSDGTSIHRYFRLPSATDESAGLMSASDKQLLDRLAAMSSLAPVQSSKAPDSSTGDYAPSEVRPIDRIERTGSTSD